MIDAKSELLIYRVLAEHEGYLRRLDDRLTALEQAVADLSPKQGA
jgi:hypothetical protein